MTTRTEPTVAGLALPPKSVANTVTSSEVEIDAELPTITKEPIREDPIAMGELQALLRRHDLWLGFSPIKGWVLLDRKHHKYDAFNRPFVLLRDGSVDFLSTAEFSSGGGPWSLSWWVNLDNETMQVSGPASAQLPTLQEHVIKSLAARDKEFRAAVESNAERSREWATRIGDLPFKYDESLSLTVPYQAQVALAKSKQYAATLPPRIVWLRQYAKLNQLGNGRLEPEWSLGQNAAQHLRERGILHLWHFTDASNLPSIRKHGGLVSHAGLPVIGANEAKFVSNEESRDRDANLGRDRFVRLSFIPNSWFFHRVRYAPLVWLRFSLNVLSQCEIRFAEGNAASAYVQLQRNLLSLEIDWEVAKWLSGPYSDNVGPTQYPAYRDQSSDDKLYGEAKKALNSEILVNHFLPIEYCEGVFECRSGKKLAL